MVWTFMIQSPLCGIRANESLSHALNDTQLCLDVLNKNPVISLRMVGVVLHGCFQLWLGKTW